MCYDFHLCHRHIHLHLVIGICIVYWQCTLDGIFSRFFLGILFSLLVIRISLVNHQVVLWLFLQCLKYMNFVSHFLVFEVDSIKSIIILKLFMFEVYVIFIALQYILFLYLKSTYLCNTLFDVYIFFYVFEISEKCVPFTCFLVVYHNNNWYLDYFCIFQCV